MGDHLKKRRMDLGITQKEAARRIGSDQWTVINWEKGRTEPAVWFVPSVIAFLGYDPLPQGASPGQRLRAARTRLGLSLAELARRLDVDEGTVGSWERGRRRLSRRIQGKVADLLGLETAGPAS